MIIKIKKNISKNQINDFNIVIQLILFNSSCKFFISYLILFFISFNPILYFSFEYIISSAVEIVKNPKKNLKKIIFFDLDFIKSIKFHVVYFYTSKSAIYVS